MPDNNQTPEMKLRPQRFFLVNLLTPFVVAVSAAIADNLVNPRPTENFWLRASVLGLCVANSFRGARAALATWTVALPFYLGVYNTIQNSITQGAVKPDWLWLSIAGAGTVVCTGYDLYLKAKKPNTNQNRWLYITTAGVEIAPGGKTLLNDPFDHSSLILPEERWPVNYRTEINHYRDNVSGCPTIPWDQVAKASAEQRKYHLGPFTFGQKLRSLSKEQKFLVLFGILLSDMTSPYYPTEEGDNKKIYQPYSKFRSAVSGKLLRQVNTLVLNPIGGGMMLYDAVGKLFGGQIVNRFGRLSDGTSKGWGAEFSPRFGGFFAYVPDDNETAIWGTDDDRFLANRVINKSLDPNGDTGVRPNIVYSNDPALAAKFTEHVKAKCPAGTIIFNGTDPNLTQALVESRPKMLLDSTIPLNRQAPKYVLEKIQQGVITVYNESASHLANTEVVIAPGAITQRYKRNSFGEYELVEIKDVKFPTKLTPHDATVLAPGFILSPVSKENKREESAEPENSLLAIDIPELAPERSSSRRRRRVVRRPSVEKKEEAAGSELNIGYGLKVTETSAPSIGDMKVAQLKKIEAKLAAGENIFPLQSVIDAYEGVLINVTLNDGYSPKLGKVRFKAKQVDRVATMIRDLYELKRMVGPDYAMPLVPNLTGELADMEKVSTYHLRLHQRSGMDALYDPYNRSRSVAYDFTNPFELARYGIECGKDILNARRMVYGCKMGFPVYAENDGIPSSLDLNPQHLANQSIMNQTIIDIRQRCKPQINPAILREAVLHLNEEINRQDITDSELEEAQKNIRNFMLFCDILTGKPDQLPIPLQRRDTRYLWKEPGYSEEYAFPVAIKTIPYNIPRLSGIFNPMNRPALNNDTHLNMWRSYGVRDVANFLVKFTAPVTATVAAAPAP